MSQAVTEKSAGCSRCCHQSFVLSCLAPAWGGRPTRGRAGSSSCPHRPAPVPATIQPHAATRGRSLRGGFLDRATDCTGVKLLSLSFGVLVLRMFTLVARGFALRDFNVLTLTGPLESRVTGAHREDGAEAGFRPPVRQDLGCQRNGHLAKASHVGNLLSRDPAGCGGAGGGDTKRARAGRPDTLLRRVSSRHSGVVQRLRPGDGWCLGGSPRGRRGLREEMHVAL